jgi:sugar O-acyltransferase (sialic acid O-acetyltransferase NeuD family)
VRRWPAVIWGSAGHAKVLADLIALRGGEVIALFDNRQVPSALDGVPVHVGEHGFEAWAAGQADLGPVMAFVAIGGDHGRDRVDLLRRMAQRGLSLCSITHPQASVAATAVIRPGAQVLAQAVAAAGAVVGEACILNNRANVDHECVLEEGVHVAPGATLCGCVHVERYSMIGAGAVVLPRIRIGENAVVGAGAVVTRDVPPGAVVAGNPARLVRTRYERGSA